MEILFILHTPAPLPLDAAVAAGTFLLVFFFFFYKKGHVWGFSLHTCITNLHIAELTWGSACKVHQR